MEDKKLRASEMLPCVQTAINSINIPDDISSIKETLEAIQANLFAIVKNEAAESGKKLKDDNIARIYLPNNLYHDSSIPR